MGTEVEYDPGLLQHRLVGRTNPQPFPFQIAGNRKYPACRPSQLVDLLAQFGQTLGLTHQDSDVVSFRTQVRQQMLTDETGPP